jgi:putative CocE/NonD family hydrolase
MAAQAVRRSYAGATLDYFGARYVGVGSEACSYTRQAVKIPMRDGIELAADFYAPELPNKQAPTGLIMIQCCYGRNPAISFINARVYAARGFQALLVSTRGTSGSGGIFDAGSHEQSDSQDIVVWMRQQPWYPGFFATLGPSYLGYSQWALLRDPPADCVAAVIPVGLHDYAWHTWGTGSFRVDRASWSDMMSATDNERGSLLRAQLSKVPGLGCLRPTGLDEAVAGLPLEASLQKYFGTRAPWLFEFLNHPNVDDVYWTTRRHQTALERVKIPILLISGWYDTFTAQTMHQYTYLRQRGVNVRLIVGPWTHVQGSGLHSMPEIMDFLAEHLAKSGTFNRSPVHIFITGSQEWRSMPIWPPAARSTILYLQEDRRLGSKQSVQDVNPASFVFDPRNPTPSIGGNQMSSGGRVDDSAYAGRSDVLVFTSDPLSEDLEVLGVPSLHLIHTSNPPFADLFVRLSEVDAQGVSHNITEVYQALEPTRDMSQPLRLNLQDCAHRFRVGMRVRLIVAGGSFPMYARCLGTAENRVRSDKTVLQEHIVTITGGVTQLILPVSTAV